MLSSHLPRAPCNKFVDDFLCGFLGIVDGYRLRRMCSHCLRASCNFLYGPSGAGGGKSVQRLSRDCTEIVQSQWSCSAVSVELPCSLRSLKTVIRRPCRFRAEAARGLCGDRGPPSPRFCRKGALVALVQITLPNGTTGGGGLFPNVCVHSIAMGISKTIAIVTEYRTKYQDFKTYQY